MAAAGSPENRWRKSRHSGNGGACVEAGALSTASVAVRDSKSPDRAFLRFGRDAWQRFLTGAKHGMFDRRPIT